MVEAEDHGPLQSKCKAITAIFPYAVLRERNGQPEMFDTILRAFRVPRVSMIMWRHVNRSVSTLLSVGSPRAVVLAWPHVTQISPGIEGAYIRVWAVAVCAAPSTEEVAQVVLGTLSRFLSGPWLLPFITTSAWSWLARQPALLPTLQTRDGEKFAHIVNALRGFKDIRILKSYLLLSWSERNGFPADRFEQPSDCWTYPGRVLHIRSCIFCTTQIMIQEDFGGDGMGCHRADLADKLDHVLVQLDRGLEYLKQHDWELDAGDLGITKDRYRRLRETLLEANTKAINRTPHLMIMSLGMLILLDGHRIPHNIYVCAPSSMSVVPQPECPITPRPVLFMPLIRYRPPSSLRLPNVS